VETVFITGDCDAKNACGQPSGRKAIPGLTAPGLSVSVNHIANESVQRYKIL